MEINNYKIATEELNKLPILHLNNKHWRPKETTIKEFIKEFIENYNEDYETFNDNDLMTCTNGKIRTFKDIYCITRFYFPEINSEIVYDSIWEIDLLVGNYCPNVKAQVYSSSNNHENFVLYFGAMYGNDLRDEYGLYPKDKYLSKIRTNYEILK